MGHDAVAGDGASGDLKSEEAELARLKAEDDARIRREIEDAAISKVQAQIRSNNRMQVTTGRFLVGFLSDHAPTEPVCGTLSSLPIPY